MLRDPMILLVIARTTIYGFASGVGFKSLWIGLPLAACLIYERVHKGGRMFPNDSLTFGSGQIHLVESPMKVIPDEEAA
jgi:hypothetical protein